MVVKFSPEGRQALFVSNEGFSGLPGGMRGSPALLVSAGLMAMAFMCIDAVLVANLVGRS